MLTEKRIEELEALGFKRRKDEKGDRLYINAEQLGLEYNNLKYSRFNDCFISGGKAERLKNAEPYINVKKRKGWVYSNDEDK